MMVSAKKKNIKTLDSDETNLFHTSIQFVDLNMSKVFFIFDRDKTQWIIYI